jgi:3-methyladenine DNA glycosylase/8-oxoguanine DNA glycosylase
MSVWEQARVEIRREVHPRWVFRLPRCGGADGLIRVRGGVLQRLLHVEEEPVVVRVAQLAPDRVLFGSAADSREAAEWGIERMRLALGIDQDLRSFYERFRFDPLIGRGVRANPGLRVMGKPEPFEALAWAICEQLIEVQAAFVIERRMVALLGRRCERTGLRDAPSAASLAAASPARLRSLDLAEVRALALIRAAREVAQGRVDLYASQPEPGWRRLRSIPGIGPWTLQMLALTGQQRLDQLPAGDLGYLKLVGRLRSGGDPWARASVEEVTELFAPYAPWAGLAGLHALRSITSSMSSSGAWANPRRMADSSLKRSGSRLPSHRTRTAWA